MRPESVILPLLFLPIFLLVFFQARVRLRHRLPMWKAFAEIARHLNLDLRESPSAGYGVPSAAGTWKGRAVRIDVRHGSSTTPVRTIVLLTHRIPVTHPLWFVEGSAPKLRVGMPGWGEKWLGPEPRETQVRVVGPKLEQSLGVVGNLGEEQARALVELVRMPSAYVAGLTPKGFAFQFEGMITDRKLLEDALERAAAAIAALEAASPPKKPTPGGSAPLLPPLGGFSGAAYRGMMVLVSFLGAILFAMAFVVGDADAAVFLGGMGAMVIGLGVATWYSSHLGPEERSILAEFGARGAKEQRAQ